MSLFNPDRAIKSKDEDLLNRSEFSSAIAKGILNWKEKDSLVLGICGEWGSGKSSVKNMCLEYLKDKEINILEFNPWQWSNQNNLNKSFFSELGIIFDRVDKSEKSKNLALKWRYYGGLIDLGTTSIPLISKAWRKIYKKAAELHELKAKLNSKTLEEIKKELADDFRAIEKPILVVIDDVDRLFPNELKLLLQLKLMLMLIFLTLYICYFLIK